MRGQCHIWIPNLRGHIVFKFVSGRTSPINTTDTNENQKHHTHGFLPKVSIGMNSYFLLKMVKSFFSLPPPWRIFYLLDFQVPSLTYEWVQSYNTTLTCITKVYTTMKSVFSRDFAVKNFGGVRTCHLPNK